MSNTFNKWIESKDSLPDIEEQVLVITQCNETGLQFRPITAHREKTLCGGWIWVNKDYDQLNDKVVSWYRFYQ